jgi:hypothetical protein
MRQLLAVLVLALLITPVIAREDAFHTLLRIEFRKGYDFANFDDAVRGDLTQGYVVHARKGQTIKMKVVTFRNDVAFTIYEPGATVWREDYLSTIVVEGHILADADRHPANDTWTAKLPVTGDYVIVFTQMAPSESAGFHGAIILR